LFIIEFIIITGILVAIYYDESRRYFWIYILESPVIVEI
jgi:hypothetical protein